MVNCVGGEGNTLGGKISYHDLMSNRDRINYKGGDRVKKWDNSFKRKKKK